MAETLDNPLQAPGNGLSRLAAAYVRAWAELGAGVTKNANNPHFGNDYADLSAVLEALKAVFPKHGLALLQMPGKMDGDKASVGGILFHESGECITFDTQLPIGAKATAQAAGSAFTYARRYQAQAVGGLAAVDDDGEAASIHSDTKSPGKGKARREAEEELGMTNYASRADAFIAEIEAFTGTVDELVAKIRPTVVEFGDERINRAFVDKKSALKAAGKAKK